MAGNVKDSRLSYLSSSPFLCRPAASCLVVLDESLRPRFAHAIPYTGPGLGEIHEDTGGILKKYLHRCITAHILSSYPLPPTGQYVYLYLLPFFPYPIDRAVE